MRRLAVIVGLAGTVGCPAPRDLVEIRLYPCLISGVEPQSVRIEIQALDDDGGAVGPAVTGVYTVPQSVFSDGFATVGYRPVSGASTIDATVWWFASEMAGAAEQADASSSYTGLSAPNAGEVIELGIESCEQGGDTDGTTSTTATTTAQTTSTSAATEGSGSTTDVTTSGSTTADTVTGGSTSQDSTGTTGGDTETTGSMPTMEGQACFEPAAFYCEPRNGGGGKLLQCLDGTWQLGEGVCPAACAMNFPTQPEFIGCAGEAESWVCLCQAVSPAPCVEDDNVCSAVDTLELCVDGQAAIARCTTSDCAYTDPDDYTCT